MSISLCFINFSTSSRLSQLQGRKWYDDWNKPSQSTKFPQTLKAIIGKVTELSLDSVPGL